MFEHDQAWQLTHALALDIYRATEHFPEEERVGLAAKSRRAAAAIPSHIARACDSLDAFDIRNSFTLAEGYLSELRAYIELSRELGYMTHAHYALLLATMDDAGQAISELKLHVQPGVCQCVDALHR